MKKFVLVTSIGCGDSKDAPGEKVYKVLEPVLLEKNKAEERLKVRVCRHSSHAAWPPQGGGGSYAIKQSMRPVYCVCFQPPPVHSLQHCMAHAQASCIWAPNT